jgi:predicted nucleic acid-binding protein
VLLRSARGLRVERRLFGSSDNLHAPQVIDLEVVQALRDLSARGWLTAERAQQALADLFDVPLAREPHDVFLLRIWALRHQMTPYDAAYVALAEALDAPVVTCDGPLARTRGHQARIELI